MNIVASRLTTAYYFASVANSFYCTEQDLSLSKRLLLLLLLLLELELSKTSD
jgi:hypothetical protein